MIQKNSLKKGKKALVALSGGVDSAVSAALLAKQGFEVVGVFFDFGGWAKPALKKAKKIAQKIGIPLKVVDARNQFQKKIIDYFVSSYKKGITPNPCVVCNREMKFELLFDLMKKEKADFVATGHYARLRREFSIFNFPASPELQRGEQFSNNFKISKFKNIKLFEASDKSKDQSYFLYKLTQKDLSRVIFPLENSKKSEVKKFARKLKLPILDEEESQDICFLLDKDTNTFLKKHLKPKSGNIIDEEGEILGKHKGLPFYTLGQRKGIEIGGTGPYFVIGKNSRKNELVVSNDPKKLLVKKFEIDQVNWINKPKKTPLTVKVQVRYHASKISARISRGGQGKLTVETQKPVRAVTPGQSAVFFKNDEVLGGGIIV